MTPEAVELAQATLIVMLTLALIARMLDR